MNNYLNIGKLQIRLILHQPLPYYWSTLMESNIMMSC